MSGNRRLVMVLGVWCLAFGAWCVVLGNGDGVWRLVLVMVSGALCRYLLLGVLRFLCSLRCLASGVSTLVLVIFVWCLAFGVRFICLVLGVCFSAWCLVHGVLLL